MNIKVVIIKLIGRHLVPGITRRMPLVSPASQIWYWMINVSREHFPMKANAREWAERRTTVALRNAMNASTGMNDM